jgi:hypothetical protein
MHTFAKRSYHFQALLAIPDHVSFMHPNEHQTCFQIGA